MAGKRKPPAPRSLGEAGRDLWRRLVNEYEFSPHELPALQNACAAYDDVKRLEDLLAKQGVTVAGSKGQLRLSAVVGELRAARLAAARLQASLQLPVLDDAGRELTPTQARARDAARVRWDLEAKRQGRPLGGIGGR